MIKIYSNIEKCTVKVTGHATNGEGKNPLVCAGISALVSGLAQNVMFAHDIKQLKGVPCVKLEEGNAEISCKPKKAHEGAIQYLFMAFDLCFRQMQNQFSNLIEFCGDEE